MRDRYFLVILCALVFLVEIPFAEYITDDTFIHLQFAKNLIGGKGFSFNAGEPTYGFTSPLWVLLISAGGLLGGELLAVSKVLGLASLLVCSVLFYFVVFRLTSDRFLSRAAALVWVFNAWSVRWGLSGMETALVTTWVVAALYFFLRESETGIPRHSPWIIGLASLVRPEAVALPIICLAATLVRRPPGAKRFFFVVAAPFVAISLTWFAYSLAQFGRLSPNTVAVKAGRFITPERVLEGMTVVGKIMGSTNGPELLLVAVVIVASVVARKYFGTLSSFHLASVGWLVLLPVGYVVRDVQIVSRYLVPALPLLVLYGFLSVRSLAGKGKYSVSAFRLATSVVAMVCILLNLSVMAFAVYPHTHSFSRDMRVSLIHLGRWFSANTPSDASVAIPDIGAFAYYSDRKVVDLGGLVTPSMIPILREHELDEVLTGFLFAEVARPEYVIDRSRKSERLLEIEELTDALQPVIEASVSNLGITRPGRFFYTAYRVDWDKLGPKGSIGDRVEQ
ncbi:MAG: hypothetical protein AMJ46_01280 [Latescibacteria bacterium DG_63]|nr:MAG: hypothetical protein AMJ46_01280 [Latescibacteria bacterium DG_63]